MTWGRGGLSTSFYNRGTYVQRALGGNYGYLPHGDSAFAFPVQGRVSRRKFTRRDRRHLRQINAHLISIAESVNRLSK